MSDTISPELQALADEFAQAIEDHITRRQLQARLAGYIEDLARIEADIAHLEAGWPALERHRSYFTWRFGQDRRCALDSIASVRAQLDGLS